MTITIDSIEQLNSLFHDVGQSISQADYEPQLIEAQQDIADYEAGIFAGEFDSNLSPWAPLKPSTIKRKEHDRILINAGGLRASLVNAGRHSRNIHETSPRGMLFGTENPNALFHQNGTSRVPAWPSIGMSVEALDKLVNKIADATVEQMKVGQ